MPGIFLPFSDMLCAMDMEGKEGRRRKIIMKDMMEKIINSFEDHHSLKFLSSIVRHFLHFIVNEKSNNIVTHRGIIKYTKTFIIN